MSSAVVPVALNASTIIGDHADRVLEHFAAFHPEMADRLGRGRTAIDIQFRLVPAVGAQMRGQDAAVGRFARLLLRFEHDRAGAVAEQHAGAAVVPVENSRKRLRRRSPAPLEGAGAQEIVRGGQREDEARAYRLQVEGGAVIDAVGAPSSTASPITHDQILRSSNGGINWAVISPSPTLTSEFYGIEMIDANTGFICGSKSAVYKTINGGANWDSVVIPNMPQNLILSKVDFVNAQTGWIFSRYLTGTDTTIFKTTNGGVNWFKQKFGTATGSENTINAACMLDENNGWLINNKPRPWKTTNGGVSWDSTALGDNYLAGSLYDIKMLNPLTGYCVGSNNRVYKTTNGGATPWSNVSFSSTTIITLYALEVLNPLECVVLGTYGTVYYTLTAVQAWQNLNLGSSIDDINGSYLTTDGKLYTRNAF